MTDLTKEYSPSLNSQRFQDTENPQDALLEFFTIKTTNDTNAARKKYQVRYDVRYGGESDNQVMDIYFKEQEDNTPIFVFIHGGYWQAFTKDVSGSFVEPLVEHGYRVIAMDYNLCPTVTLAELVQQTETFFDWLFDYANQTHAKHVAICGFSAGAHMAATLLSPRLLNKYKLSKGFLSLFLISGIYDLRVLAGLECVNPQNILGLDAEAAEALSPQLWSFNDELISLMRTNSVHVSLLVGGHESRTFIEQSRNFYNKLHVIENRDFKIFDNDDHFSYIENAPDATSELTTYILEKLDKQKILYN